MVQEEVRPPPPAAAAAEALASALLKHANEEDFILNQGNNDTFS